MPGKFKAILFLLCISFTSFAQQKNLVPYVDPFIGTGGHAHTFSGACYPFGMMQLSPDTRLTGWDGCSGYHYHDTIIYGFSHTHLSGTGCSDYGDILILPTFSPHYKPDSILSKNKASFSHKQEKASAGFYSVILNYSPVKSVTAELTVGERAGIHRYVFNNMSRKNMDEECILVDLQHRDEVISSELNMVSDTEICGYRESKAWAKDQWVYFDIRFSKPILVTTLYNNNKLTPLQKVLDSKNIKAFFRCNSDSILIKIGISAVSIENAKENLVHDIPDWDFDGTLKKTQKAWNDYLNKIEVTSKNDSLLTTFYTALYHTAIHPSLYTDINGQYRGRDMKIHTAKDFSMYTVFSIWDTYRALHPLFTVIDSSIDRQFIQTFLKQYEQGGMLPVWELSANETNCMIGYHSVSIIEDAYQKGIRGFNANEALAAMEHSADADSRGLPALRQYGYIPADKSSESVSQTLECAYDDWCVAQMAKSLGRTDDYKRYIELAQSYKNVYNPNNGFMQGRQNGAFITPFDPKSVTFNYTEANAWQYSFYAPQDMNGFIDLHGGKGNLALKLDTLFTTSTKTTGRTQPDITGMLGQYAQGNEPSHHIAYLYNYVGQPWKTAKYVHQLEKFYTAKPDGICGNDDCGELSAWYVMSAIGMYQVCPGDGQFELTAPIFDTVKIHLESGKTFTILSKGVIDPLTTIDYTKNTQGPKPRYQERKYIESAELNGRNYPKSFLKYDDLMKGGKLVYDMGDRIIDWGTRDNVPLDSISSNYKMKPLPYFEYDNSLFTDSMKVVVRSFSQTDKAFRIIYWVVTGPDIRTTFSKWKVDSAYYIHKTGYYTILFAEGDDSLRWDENPSAYFAKIPKGRKIKIISKPNSQYTAGGQNALIDFQHGSSDFRVGKWQGYQYTDFEAVVDLGKVEEVKNVSAEFLQDALSYIYMPTYVDFSVSTDSIHFTQVAHVINGVSDTLLAPTIKSMEKDITPQKVRYVKIFAKNYGKLPPWHPGYGDEAFIFIDEIEVK